MGAQENKQTAQAAYAAFGRGDAEGAMRNIDDSIEWTARGDNALTGTYRGKQAVGELWGKLASKDFRSEPHDFIADGDKVVVLTTAHLEGETAEAADVLTYNADGRLVAFEQLGDGRPSPTGCSLGQSQAALRGIQAVAHSDRRAGGHARRGSAHRSQSANVARAAFEPALASSVKPYVPSLSSCARCLNRSAVCGERERAADGDALDAQCRRRSVRGRYRNPGRQHAQGPRTAARQRQAHTAVHAGATITPLDGEFEIEATTSVEQGELGITWSPWASRAPRAS